MDKETFEKLKAKVDENMQMTVVGIKPPAKYCHSCVFALPDTEYTDGASKPYCAIFEKPESKPNDVLMKNAECPAYVKR